MKKREAMRKWDKDDDDDDDDEGMFSSRSFAIGLVGVASCYLVVMICKAYRRMNEEDNYYGEESITYYYDTESYDFHQYETIKSTDDQYARQGVARGFEYNKSIGTSSNIDDNESAEMRAAIYNRPTMASAQGDMIHPGHVRMQSNQLGYDSDGNFENNKMSPIVYHANNKVGDVQYFRGPNYANNSFERVQ